MKKFWRKNMTWFHIASILICVLFAVFYWWKAGQFSEYFFKNRLYLMILWGILVGWITGDFLNGARNRKE